MSAQKQFDNVIVLGIPYHQLGETHAYQVIPYRDYRHTHSAGFFDEIRLYDEEENVVGQFVGPFALDRAQAMVNTLETRF